MITSPWPVSGGSLVEFGSDIFLPLCLNRMISSSHRQLDYGFWIGGCQAPPPPPPHLCFHVWSSSYPLPRLFVNWIWQVFISASAWETDLQVVILTLATSSYLFIYIYINFNPSSFCSTLMTHLLNVLT